LTEPARIPGDIVAITMNSVVHEMNLEGVTALFEHESAFEELVLTGIPEETQDLGGEQRGPHLKISKVTITAVVPEDATPGLYRCTRLVAVTYAGRDIPFAPSTEKEWSDWSIQVQEEPSTPPRFHLHE
jgi:hypothetical protein